MTTNQRIHTLQSIAVAEKVSKRTVQRWLSRYVSQTETHLGQLIEDIRMFSDAERDALVSYKSTKNIGTEKQSDDTSVTVPITPSSVEIYEGNHQETLANIDMNTQFDLGQLRSPLVEVQSYQDPLSMAQQLIVQNSQIVGAMSADLQQRQVKINEANQALALVEQSNHNLMLQAQQYQIESRVQAAVLNQTTTQLQQKIQLQQNLGKPAGMPSEQSQQ